MPANVAELQIKVTSNQVKVADDRLEKLNKTSRKTSTTNDKLGKSFKGMAAKVGVAAVGFAGLMSAFNNLRSLQKLQAQLKTATGSVIGAEMAFAELQKTAVQMPNSLEDVTNAFITLKNLGLDPSEAAILSYGNTAASMGKSLDQFIQAVADASTREFERLKEFGIKASQQGDRVSLTFRNVTTTIGNNSKEIEGFLQGLGEKEFAGSMAAQMETIDGKLTNLDDSWFRFTNTVMDGNLGDIAGDSITTLSKILDHFTDSSAAANIIGRVNVGGVEALGVPDIGAIETALEVSPILQRPREADFRALIEGRLEELKVLQKTGTAEQTVIDLAEKRKVGAEALADLQAKIDADNLSAREKIKNINLEMDAINKSLFEGSFSNASVEIAQLEKKREERQKLLDIEKKRLDQEARAKKQERAEREREAQQEQRLDEQKLAAKKQFFSDLAFLAKDSNSKLFKVTQAAALADASVRGGQAVMNAYATGGPFPANLIAGAMMAAKVAAEIKTIQSGNFEDGGFVGGSSFSGDNVPINVNSGEAVLNASQQRNFMRLANGEVAGGKSTIVIKNFGVETTTEDRRNGNGEMMTIITNRVRQAVNNDVTQDFLNGGPISRSAENSYGLRRGGI